MNRSPAKIMINKHGLFTPNRTPSILLVGIVLCVFAGSALANRPAMDEPLTQPTDVSDSSHSSASQMDGSNTPAEQNANQHRPAAPSAVELMMRQQPQYQQYSGDVLQLPAKEMQVGETLKIQLLDSPRRGTSMETVQQQFGQPITTSASIGQPPITHWTYNDRIVYFEFSTVLHVVAR